MESPIGLTTKPVNWPDYVTKTLEMKTKYCGLFKVYVQGTQERGKIAFITVHDIGSNHVPFCQFVASKQMEEVTKHSTWYHVCLPGQNDRDSPLPENTIYPTLDAIAHDLLQILETSNLKAVIGFGEGAGGNILLRFGLMYSNRCLGLVLINCTASTARVDERLNSTLSHLLENAKKLVQRFRGIVHHDGEQQIPKKSTCPANLINLNNIEKYAEAYGRRTDITKFLIRDLNTDCLLVTGRQSPNNPLCQELLRHMGKIRTTLLVVDDAEDVLYQNQKDTVRSLILFCKGCGVLLGVPMLGLEHEFNAVKCQPKSGQTEAQKELGHQIKLYEEMLHDEAN